MMKSTEDDEKAITVIHGHSTKTFRNSFRLTKRPFSRIHFITFNIHRGMRNRTPPTVKIHQSSEIAI